MASQSMSPSLPNRMMRALRVDRHLYEEVEADKNATPQAALVVVLGSIATGLAFLTTGGVMGLALGMISSLLSWAVWAWLNFMIGSKLLAEPTTEANWGQLARTMGFAYTPNLFNVLAIIPVPALQGLIGFIVRIWIFAGMVIAVRQALDYKSTLRAAGVALLGLFVSVLPLVLLVAISGGAAK